VLGEEWAQLADPGCAYYAHKQKCKCKGHKPKRDEIKAINFGIVYDKQAHSLSLELGISKEAAQLILDRWKATFVTTQATLEKMRDDAYESSEARTIGGRRRILTRVSEYQILKKAKDWYGEFVETESEVDVLVEKQLEDGTLAQVIERRTVKEKKIKKYSTSQLERVKQYLISAVKREGGNMPVQGTGADMMKRAMGCGFDINGNPYLWHILEPEFDALLCNYVYDEFGVETPDEHCDAVGGPNGVGGVVSDAIIRAGAEFVTVVPMASEGAVLPYWSK
jgi:DNA polymerase I-like protein with 3'-5' exonuclease and polymerase domains